VAFATLPTFYAGHKPTAAEYAAVVAAVAELRPIRARKTGPQSVTSSTTLVDDSELLLPVDGSSEYEVLGLVFFSAAVAGDLKIGWSGPSGAGFSWSFGGGPSTISSASDIWYHGSNTIGGTDIAGGTGSNAILRVAGVLTTTNAGTLLLRWAQGTSSGTATSIVAPSVLIARKIL
jgi:hypothetical protein